MNSKSIIKKVMCGLDWGALGYGLIVMLYYIIVKPWAKIDDCCWLSLIAISIAAALGAIHIGIATYYFVCRRPVFDWHMLYGRFLVKVVSIVVLTPFIIALFANLCNADLTQSQFNYDGSVWSIFSHFVDPGNIVSVRSDQAGWATLVALLGVFLLNGLLIASLIGWFDSRKAQWLSGQVDYDFFLKRHEHYIIIGGNDMVAGIVRQIFDQHKLQEEEKGLIEGLHLPYILIQTSRDVEEFRMELFSNLTELEQCHVIIYYGNRTSKRDIAKLKVRSAKKVYIIGEDVRSDDTESYHDTMNMECLELIRKHLGKVHKKLTCHVMFEYQTTFSVFQYSEISNNIKDFIDFKPFNYYDSWAQQVLIGRTEEYLPLEGAEGIRADSPKQVHLIIVGMSRMGISMAINAAHLAHYPNFDSNGIRTKITFIDKAANEEKDFFMGRFKELFALSKWSYGNVEGDEIVWNSRDVLHNYEHLGGDFLDIEWEFLNGSVEKEAIQQYLSDASADENRVVTIAICLPEPSRCLAAALYLKRDIYNNVNQILVYNRYGDSLVTQMTHKGDKQINPYHNKMRAFGMAYDFYNLELVRNIEKLAHRIQDEYNKIYPPDPEEKYGKSEMAKWWSNVYSASTAWCKMRCIGWDGERELTDDEVNILAKVEHARWNMEQLLMGYRPIDATKQKELTDITDKKEKKTKKNKLKSQMIHLNICSFNKLEEIDGGSIQVDKGISSIIAEELKCQIVKKDKEEPKTTDK